MTKIEKWVTIGVLYAIYYTSLATGAPDHRLWDIEREIRYRKRCT